MTFLNQVKGLTGLTISSSGTTPTQDELSQFLRDGVMEVVNRIIEVRPDETPKFCTTTEDTGNSGVTVKGKIISVVREHDSTEILRPCTPILPADRYEATDKTSLKYRSKYNPGYYILDQKIHSIPASAGNDNDLKVSQVSYDTGLTHDDSESGIENFPREYSYLIPLYAAIKSLEAKMAEYTIDEEDPELVQSLSVNIASLKNSYQESFGIIAPRQERREERNES